MSIGRAVVKRLAWLAFLGAVFLIALAAFTNQQHPSLAQPPAPVCDAACHAQGLAQIQRDIDTKVSALTRGHQCYPVDPSRLTKYLVVRNGESVVRVTFDRAWALNHDTSKTNDVWVLARCN